MIRSIRTGACAGLLGLVVLLITSNASAEPEPFSFGVVMQRSPLLTAEYWNPILRYVSQRSGVPLQLKLGKTGEETSRMIGRGEFDFVYSNHNFVPANEVSGYSVIARPLESAIRGQIVVLEDSPIASIGQLRGKEVAFPHRQAFAGFFVTMDALLRAGIEVKPVFAGNQEGAMGQLKSRRVVAASVNSLVMRGYAARENLQYRILWSSEEFLNIPISAHPRIPAEKVRAVQEALVSMADDTEGVRILAASAEIIKQQPPYGFVRASDRDYDSVRRTYRHALIKAD